VSHDDVHVVVEASLEDVPVELSEHLVAVRVDRRVVQREDGDALFGHVVDERAHLSSSPA